MIRKFSSSSLKKYFRKVLVKSALPLNHLVPCILYCAFLKLHHRFPIVFQCIKTRSTGPITLTRHDRREDLGKHSVVCLTSSSGRIWRHHTCWGIFSCITNVCGIRISFVHFSPADGAHHSWICLKQSHHMKMKYNLDIWNEKL